MKKTCVSFLLFIALSYSCKNPEQVNDKKSLVYKGMPPNHTCVDQALRIAPNGDWIVIFMTGGAREPEIDNHIRMCRSADQGYSWGEAKVVLKYPDKACLLSEVIVHNKTITVFVSTHGGHFDHWRVWTINSQDNGHTWSEPQEFSPLPRRTFIRNLYITSNGNWILPFQTYDTVKEPSASPFSDGSHKKAMNGVLISHDEGQTFEKSNLIGPTAGWAENNVVERSDGSLVMLIRADKTGRLFQSESFDNGLTWSQPQPTDIPNPGSKFRLFRLSDGRIVLIHNPNPKTSHPNSKNAAQCNRNPLSMWISRDNMKTWGYKRMLVDFPGMLAYPDGIVDEQEEYIHFVFDYNRHDVIYWGAKLP